MAMIYTARETLVDAHPSFTALLTWRIAETPDKEAFRYRDANDEWQSLTWKEEGDEASLWAAALIDLGLDMEERVGIAAETRMDWITACLAITLAGGACTTVYSSTGAEDVAYILSDSNTKILFVEDDTQLQKVLEERENLPELQKVVLFDGEGDGDFSISLEQLREIGRAALAKDPDLVKNRSEAVDPGQLATLIYTSGTTGKPKGVELLQTSWGYTGAAVPSTRVLDIDDVQFLWLPMAHVFGTVLLVSAVQVGCSTAVDGRVPKILENIGSVKPTFMGAVPRIFEKVYAAIEAMAKAGGPDQEQAFKQGVDIGRRYLRATLDGGEADEQLKQDFEVANELVFALVRGAMGGNIRFFISGSAPLAAEICEFFDAAGMPILEGYGLTETSAIATVGRPSTIMPGTVGEAQPGTEITIADDGEILVRSPAVMRGYRNRPADTAAVFVGDGWFATGDIGEFDDRDRLKITDRKKDLFKTSGGKYVAPSPIESQFKALCGLASNMVIQADNRKFVSALITLDPEAAAAWATAHGKPTDLASLAHDEELIATIQAAIDELNSRLNHWERIRKFIILDRDFSVDAGELTPSLKVKRKVIEQRNKELIDSIYA